MPQRNRSLLKTLLPLGLAAMLLAVIRRRPDEWEYQPVDEEPSQPTPAPAPAERAAGRHPTRRFGLAATFTVLFFAGAAFTAGAGDQAAQLLEGDAASLEAAQPEPAMEAAGEAAAEAAPEAPAPEAPAPEAPAPEAPAPEAPAAEAPAAEAPAPDASAPEAPAPTETAPEAWETTPEVTTPAPEAAAESPAPEAAAPVEAAPAEAAPAEPAPADAAPADAAAPEAEATPTSSSGPSNLTGPAPAPTRATTESSGATAAKPAPARKAKSTKQWVVRRAAERPAQKPEVEHEGHDGSNATVWLNRSLPDPTPASARLQRSFARQLVAASKRHGADWAAVLAVLRAQGERGAAPASARQLDTLAARLGKTNAWKGALALSGRTGFADRAAALADLYRFVGVETLVTGYTAGKDRLAKKVLNAPGVLIYEGGRQDIVHGRIDVRVLALIGYLAERHGGVTVSSLFSGHRMFARPGVVSAHMYGHAIDIAAVGGTPILGNQQPGGLTEAAVRSVLLLPSELQPRQVISLLGLGGPSFPMRDHGDHIHVGY